MNLMMPFRSGGLVCFSRLSATVRSFSVVLNLGLKKFHLRTYNVVDFDHPGEAFQVCGLDSFRN